MIAKKKLAPAPLTPAERCDSLIADLARIEEAADRFINDWIAENAAPGVPVGVSRQCTIDTAPYVRDGYSFSAALRFLRSRHIRD